MDFDTPESDRRFMKYAWAVTRDGERKYIRVCLKIAVRENVLFFLPVFSYSISKLIKDESKQEMLSSQGLKSFYVSPALPEIPNKEKMT